MLPRRWTLAQMYTIVVAPALVVIGLVGFAFDSSFAAGSRLHGDTELILELNGWHNAVHLGFGLAGLAVLSKPRLARLFALAWGSTALLLLVWGFTSQAAVVGLIPVNVADNYLHVLDATGLLAALLSRPAATPGLKVGRRARM